MGSKKRSSDKLWMESAEHELSSDVEPLSETERAWLDEFAAVMERMPERLLVFECHGRVTIVDKAASRLVDLEDGKAHENGVVLASVISATCDIISAAG